MTSTRTTPTQEVLIKCKGDNSNLILTAQGIIIERRGGF